MGEYVDGRLMLPEGPDMGAVEGAELEAPRAPKVPGVLGPSVRLGFPERC